MLNSSHVRRKIEKGPKLQPLFQSGPRKTESVGELYLAILSRQPTEEELKTAQAHVKNMWADSGLRDLAWVLINSAEFCY